MEQQATLPDPPRRYYTLYHSTDSGLPPPPIPGPGETYSMFGVETKATCLQSLHDRTICSLAGRRERITLPRRRGASEARNRTRAIVSRRRRLVLCTSQCSVYSNCADPRTEMKRLNHALLLNVTEMLRFMSQNAGADSTLAMSKVQ